MGGTRVRKGRACTVASVSLAVDYARQTYVGILPSVFSILVLTISLFAFGCTNADGRYVGSVYYPVNEQGQTYGASDVAYENLPDGVSGREAADYLPDLVLVENSDGVEGYVLKGDFLPQTPTSPQEALEMQESGAFSRKEVPMYASDGVTVVGTFSVG